MLFDFQIELAAKKLAYRSKRNNSRKADNYYDTYSQHGHNSLEVYYKRRKEKKIRIKHKGLSGK
jgi:hypothetical protein